MYSSTGQTSRTPESAGYRVAGGEPGQASHLLRQQRDGPAHHRRLDRQRSFVLLARQVGPGGHPDRPVPHLLAMLRRLATRAARLDVPPELLLRRFAVHGMTSVPFYPASHGCVRMTVPAMVRIWSSMWVACRSRSTVPERSRSLPDTSTQGLPGPPAGPQVRPDQPGGRVNDAGESLEPLRRCRG